MSHDFSNVLVALFGLLSALFKLIHHFLHSPKAKSVVKGLVRRVRRNGR
jgi:hypothetical protein